MAKVSSQFQERYREIMNRKQSLVTLGLCALVGLVLLTACSKKPSEEQSAAPGSAAAPAAAPIDPATAASVSGTVSLAGAAPKAAKIDMSQDPAWKGTNTAETVVADGSKLANVFVYVKEGCGHRTGRQVGNQRSASRRLHVSLRARKDGYAGAEGHAGGQR